MRKKFGVSFKFSKFVLDDSMTVGLWHRLATSSAPAFYLHVVAHGLRKTVANSIQ